MARFSGYKEDSKLFCSIFEVAFKYDIKYYTDKKINLRDALRRDKALSSRIYKAYQEKFFVKSCELMKSMKSFNNVLKKWSEGIRKHSAIINQLSKHKRCTFEYLIDKEHTKMKAGQEYKKRNQKNKLTEYANMMDTYLTEAVIALGKDFCDGNIHRFTQDCVDIVMRNLVKHIKQFDCVQILNNFTIFGLVSKYLLLNKDKNDAFTEISTVLTSVSMTPKPEKKIIPWGEESITQYGIDTTTWETNHYLILRNLAPLVAPRKLQSEIQNYEKNRREDDKLRRLQQYFELRRSHKEDTGKKEKVTTVW